MNSDNDRLVVYIRAVKPKTVAVHFPPMKYQQVKQFSVPRDPRKLVLGGSYTIHHYTPLFEQRRLMFEENIFPYEYNFKHISVRHGVLLMPQINRQLMTNLDDPSIVYLLNTQSKYVARFKFYPEHVTYSELVE